jgi:hypothetical protein
MTREVLAGLLALLLLVVAMRLATALHWHRRRRARARSAQEQLGRRLVAELPFEPEFVYVTEDAASFHVGAESVPKSVIRSARLLLNGRAIATVAARRTMKEDSREPQVAPPAGLAIGASGGTSRTGNEPFGRDRWDVEIETADRCVVVECGSIRERVSNELARRIFDAVARAIEAADLEALNPEP